MKSIICFLLLAYSLGFNNLQAQENATTFILVRHAEKDLTQSTDDPDLSAEGKLRAERLKTLLEDAEVTAIYSTPYKRTRQTVQPLAEALGMKITSYDQMDFEGFAKMVEEGNGGKIVVAGHSYTIPALMNSLLDRDEYQVLEDGEYGQVLILTLQEIGEGTVLILNSN
ncbi:MAG: phosphoglycerate mutase family protein [Candidatus Cyclobacteriaceae bacterium M2_1C_046]